MLTGCCRLAIGAGVKIMDELGAGVKIMDELGAGVKIVDELVAWEFTTC
jgi:hypothetical protein